MEKFKDGLNILCKVINSLCKGLALFIPTVISIALLLVIILKLDGATTDIRILELKMDSIIGIIGVAVSVWIGLNIYNLTRKNEIEREVEECANNYIKFETSINNTVNDLKTELTTSNENLQTLKNELKQLGIAGCSLQISKKSMKEIGEEKIYGNIKSAITSYCRKNENLIIILELADINPKNEYLWNLRSNQDLSSEHLENIKQLVIKDLPNLDIQKIVYM